MKRKSLFILLVFLIALPCMAQNNPYKIDDRMYSLFLKINKEFGTSGCLEDINTMFRQAGELHDQKAQCIAMVQKAKHFYRLRPLNEASLIAAVGECKAFTRNTPYLQYYFNGWTSLIIYYLNNEKYNEAMAQIKQFQKDAIAMKCDYGIAESYRQLGHLFSMLDIFDQAREQYQKCADYLISHGNAKQAYELYISIAECYYKLNNQAKGLEYAQKFIDTAPAEHLELKGYAIILSYMPDGFDSRLATQYFNDMKRLRQKYGFGVTSKDVYYDACSQYYTIIKDPVMALAYSDSINTGTNANRRISSNYYSLGDYKNAYHYLNRFVLRRDSLNFVKIGQTVSFYTAQFGLDQLEMDRRELEFQNANMRLERERRELLEARSRDSMNLIYSDLALHSEQQKHLNDSLRYQKEHDIYLLQVKSQKTRLLFVAIILVVLMLGGILFIYDYIVYTNKLKREKSVVEDALEVSRKAEKFKSMFLNNMSHEIRTPLNAIVGFTELLNMPEAGLEEGEREELLGLVKKNSDLLTTLVNDLLDLSRMQNGNYKLCLVQASANDLCQQACKTIEARVPQGVQLRFAPHEHDVLFTTDTNRVMQVLINYLTNACKFTEKGSIEISYCLKGSDIEFSVTDTGSGISQDKAADIFNRFAKLDEFKQGTGLGLNICTTIATLLHGKVWLDTSYTGGARFVFSQPASINFHNQN